MPGRKSKIESIETRFKRPVKDLIIDMYYHRKMTQEQIAAELQITVGTVSRWMKWWGFPTRGWALPEPPGIEQTGGCNINLDATGACPGCSVGWQSR